MPPTSVGSMPVRFEVHPNRSEGTLASSPIVLHTKVCGKRGCQWLFIRCCFMPCLHLKQQTTVLGIL